MCIPWATIHAMKSASSGLAEMIFTFSYYSLASILVSQQYLLHTPTSHRLPVISKLPLIEHLKTTPFIKCDVLVRVRKEHELPAALCSDEILNVGNKLLPDADALC